MNSEPSIVCPTCRRHSYSPRDILERYCGYCHQWHTDMIKYKEDFGGVIPNDNELRFWRLIDERSMKIDGTQEIELPCGHILVLTVPLPETQQYYPCTLCRAQFHTWFEPW